MKMFPGKSPQNFSGPGRRVMLTFRRLRAPAKQPAGIRIPPYLSAQRSRENEGSFSRLLCCFPFADNCLKWQNTADSGLYFAETGSLSLILITAEIIFEFVEFVIFCEINIRYINDTNQDTYDK
jgi:hypothetical protein